MFHPNMSATTEGFAVTGALRYRAWQGVLADVWEVEGRAGAGGEYLSQHPRLFVVLEQSASGSITLGSTATRCATGSADPAARLSFIPAGMRTWSHVPNGTRLRHLDLHFDLPALASRFPGELDPQRLETPRLMFDEERLLSLARLLAAECINPSLHELYGDSIALALFVELFQLPPPSRRQPGQLSPRRLRHVLDHIEAHCLRRIRLQELADLLGLSQSYFSAACKASTGMGPHQWQTRARLERVKALLLKPEATLTEVAIVAGFADQAHMTRVFKQYAGVTPAAWVRAQAPTGANSAKLFNPTTASTIQPHKLEL